MLGFFLIKRAKGCMNGRQFKTRTSVKTNLILFFFLPLQTEISKRLSALINQLVPFLSQEHQQQVLAAVERAKQITMSELNAVIGVSINKVYRSPQNH